jgi:uncharacterized membrane protein
MRAFLRSSGRLILGAAFIGFAAEYGLYVVKATVRPGPPWPLGSIPLNCMVGGVFLAVGLALLFKRFDSTVAIGFSALLLIYVSIVDLPILLRNVRAPAPWTSGFEVIALTGVCLFYSSRTSKQPAGSFQSLRFVHLCERLGLALFAFSLIVFGVQHLFYAHFVAALIPSWIPFQLFFAYFTGLAFLVSAISIALRKFLHAGAGLLGLMFLVWVMVLHLPRVAGALHNGDEWTSMFIALSMAGGAMFIAGG